MVSGGKWRELAGGFARTTNNRMELLAAIVGLEALKRPADVTVTSDSRYLVDAINRRWVDGWRLRGWRKPDRQAVKNADLWQRLLAAAEPHRVEWQWVRGHAGHRENERCDELATTAAAQPDLPPDPGAPPAPRVRHRTRRSKAR